MPNYNLAILVTAKDAASGVLGGVGKALSGLGTVAVAGLAAAGAAAVGVGVAIGKMAADAAPLQGVRAAFEGIAASSGKSADEMLAALKRGSAGMIAQGDLMKSYNSAAQLVGTTFANQLPDAMGYLSKVAAATGQDMGFMMDSLVKGVGRLSPMILDNLGIQVSLEEATARAAEMFGVEAKELTKAQTQAGMMDVVLAKLKNNTAAMPEVAGSTAASMAALSTTFADVKTQIGTAFLPVLTTFVNLLSELWTTHGPAVMAAIEGIAGVVATLATSLSGLVGGKVSFDNLIPPGVLDVFASFQVLLYRLGQWWDTYGPAIQAKAAEMFGLLQEAGAKVASEVLPWLAAQLDKFGAWFEENGPLISAFAQVVMEAFTRIWQEVLAAWSWIAPVLDLLIDLILDVAKIIMQVATGDWAGAWQTIQDLVVTAWEHIKEIWVAFADWVAAWFGSSWAEIMDMWTRNWEMFKLIVSEVWARIKEFFDTGIAKIKAAFAIDWGALGKKIIDGIGDGIKNAVGGLARRAADAAKAAFDAAKRALGIHSPSSLFREKIGLPMMEGIAEGVLEGVQIVQKAIGEAVKGIGGTSGIGMPAFGGGTSGIGLPGFAPGVPALAGGGAGGHNLYITVYVAGDVWSTAKAMEIADIIAEEQRRRGNRTF